MKTSAYLLAWLAAGGIGSLVALTGCEGDTAPASADNGSKPPAKPVETTKKLIGPNVFFEVRGDQRRVIVSAAVCLREGQLEQLLCRKRTKEHEAILAADVDARHIHAALLAAGAQAGSTVKFEPKYQPAAGSRIKVTLQYEQNGKLVSVPAQQWIRNIKTKKDLTYPWVFAGSQLQSDPLDKDKPRIYAANRGDLICVSNFETALLDLPVSSPKDNADLVFEAHTERIPPLDTKVAITLEPEPEPKKKAD